MGAMPQPRATDADSPALPPAPLHAIDWAALRGPLLVALPGAGCTPAVLGGLRAPGWTVQPVDWAEPPLCPHSCDPRQVARRLADSLRQRAQDGHAGPVVLLGYSVGGVLAMLTALQPGLPVAGLVVGNTGAHSARHGDPAFAQRVREAWAPPAQHDFLRACFAQMPPSALWRQLCDYLASLPPSALLQSIEGLRALDLRPDLPSLHCPVLVLHGEQDRRRGVADAIELAACLPMARLQLLPGGHTPMVDCLPRYLRALHPFLAGLHPPRTDAGARPA
ncbi:MAG: alpha/beta hydrolase [Ottowia sp.]|jgi:pimeloyl-ACP methyl ester carboxylesterase|nr:alpha/beta hydrolase [Ottowia sp.]MBK6744996.1 alpha/beta hydrolase [Ottowia sp.]